MFDGVDYYDVCDGFGYCVGYWWLVVDFFWLVFGFCFFCVVYCSILVCLLEIVVGNFVVGEMLVVVVCLFWLYLLEGDEFVGFFVCLCCVVVEFCWFFYLCVVGVGFFDDLFWFVGNWFFLVVWVVDVWFDEWFLGFWLIGWEMFVELDYCVGLWVDGFCCFG